MRCRAIAEEFRREFNLDAGIVEKAAVQIMQCREIAHGNRHMMQADIALSVEWDCSGRIGYAP